MTLVILPQRTAPRARTFAEPKRASISAASAQASAMICLVPPPALADGLRVQPVPGVAPEAPGDVHLTLLYYPAGFTDAAATDRALRMFAAARQPLTGTISGLARFSADAQDGDPLVVLPDVPGLPDLRHALIAAAPIGWSDTHGFTPHMTVAYMAPDVVPPVRRVTPRPVTFDSLWVWSAGERRRYRFGEYT